MLTERDRLEVIREWRRGCPWRPVKWALLVAFAPVFVLGVLWGLVLVSFYRGVGFVVNRM